MAAATHLKDDFKNPWFLAILGLIAVALAGTVWMAMIAGATSPGLVSEDYYEKGSNYFHELPKAEQGPQWRLNLLPPAKPKVGVSQLYRLYVISEAGLPVSDVEVTLHAYRPSDAKADFQLKMVHSDAGTFTAPLRFALPGTWDLIAHVNANGQQYEITQRLFVGD